MSDVSSEGGFAIGQIIDHAGETTDEFERLANEWKLNEMGDEYAIVAVLGCQSSGKSTLLNMLYGTPFAVMDARFGRSQTTQGLWLGRDASEPAWLVLDVEGNDSRERGEDHTAWERKTALFSLALADVLMVNMWCTDFGRWDAANLGILKTVFSVNIQLFASGEAPKKLLYFVVRDYDEDTPKDSLRNIICTDVGKIWESIPKPDAFANAAFETFFDLAFVYLPHYKHCKDQFRAEVDTLRAEFHARNEETGALALAAPGPRVAAIDLPRYADQIWATIKANKDLSLPSEREMLAIYRCDAVLNEQLDEAGSVLDGLESFATEPIAAALARALSAYDAETKLYHSGVVAESRSKLQAQLLARAAPSFEAELVARSAAGVAAAQAVLDKELPGNPRALAEVLAGDGTFDFVGVMAQARAAGEGGVAELEALADAEAWPSVPFEAPPSPLWRASRAGEQAATELSRVLDGAHTKFVGVVLDTLVAEATAHMEQEGELHVLLRSGSAEMWDSLRELRNAALEAVQGKLVEIAAGMGASGSAAEGWQVQLAARVDAVLGNAVEEFVKVLPLALRQTFDDHFKFGPDRLPIRWKPGDDIDARYREARAAALGMLDNFASNELADPPTPLLSNLARRQLAAQLENDLRGAYLDAQQQLEAVSIRSAIPPWVLPLLLVLGFNEMWMILTSPLLLVTTLLGGGLVAFLYAFNMLGPVKAMVLGEGPASAVDAMMSLLSSSSGAGSSGAGSSATVGKAKAKAD
ncbi:YOP1 enhancer, variant [Thecamonas trahens ATCC 50062]|uniref:Protein SEY1 homolog n=1 Tax=Thecamonas trahens ATCC 50062 TaxID=461836 RepID=A0A0L0DXB3_THETB|nr:YOP1 enhancer, variant [Thecamonas trahens ATCC 50062]KNC56168.1 YOP1 enhancer, variant [Thecamonas trahens ATCC 50062]|eukprot:XP_013761205.1 YOP1 enhancer, variant [Thecamonas trahens ATCC 50062]